MIRPAYRGAASADNRRTVAAASSHTGANVLPVIPATEDYVRRRRWGDDEKRAIIEEAAANGNVIGTAKRSRSIVGASAVSGRMSRAGSSGFDCHRSFIGRSGTNAGSELPGGSGTSAGRHG